jgi:hypothetical protein
MEVRRVTTVSTQGFEARTLFSLWGTLKGFYRCKKPYWLGLSLIGLVALARLRRSLIYEARHVVTPSNPCGN